MAKQASSRKKGGQQKKQAKRTNIKKQTINKPKETPKQQHLEFALAKQNYIYLAIGFAVIILGFILMVGGGSTNPNEFNGEELFSFRRITLAPIIILLGFAFEIWAIMHKPKKSEKQQISE